MSDLEPEDELLSELDEDLPEDELDADETPDEEESEGVVPPDAAP